jgi:hypothetical protein
MIMTRIHFNRTRLAKVAPAQAEKTAEKHALSWNPALGLGRDSRPKRARKDSHSGTGESNSLYAIWPEERDVSGERVAISHDFGSTFLGPIKGPSGSPNRRDRR